jgi:N-acyl-D-amino-acid deacylase
MEIFDLLFRGGKMIDGTGAPARHADVGIRADRIERIASSIPAAAAARVIDLHDRVLCPGFVDLHSHSDLLFSLGTPGSVRLLEGRVRQGITTELVGNCGIGVAPLVEESFPEIQFVTGFITPDGVDWEWRSIAGYLERLESIGVPLNVGTLIGHGAVRVAAMGMRQATATGSQLARMETLIGSGLDEGAFGLSFGLIYAPGQFADTDELVRLCGVVASRGGFACFHQRSGSRELLLDSVRELIEVGDRSGAPVHHSHDHAQGRAAWDLLPEVIAMEEAAAARGLDLTQDVIPYPSVCTTMLAIYPSWALSAGVPAFLDLLREPESRARMRGDIETTAPSWPPWEPGRWPLNIVRDVGWGNIHVAHVNRERNRRWVGMNLEELGRAVGQDPFEAVSDLVLDEEGILTQMLFGISGDRETEDPLKLLLRHPTRSFVTDAWDIGKGSPHPGAYGTCPRVLGRFVRDEAVIPLEEAIRKMTSLPAARMGLTDRGAVREGSKADLVVFDPDTVRDRSDYLNPRVFPEGIDHVVINGRVVVSGGDWLESDAGRVLRRS